MRSRRALAAFLVSAGATHFMAPQMFDRLIPGWLPFSPRFWTHASGVAEVATGAAVWKDARIGGWAALALFVGVYPANIKDTVDQWPPTTPRGIGSLLRLPMQFPLFAWAWKVAHSADTGSSALHLA